LSPHFGNIFSAILGGKELKIFTDLIGEQLGLQLGEDLIKRSKWKMLSGTGLLCPGSYRPEIEERTRTG
jgi:hypothetical protein